MPSPLWFRGVKTKFPYLVPGVYRESVSERAGRLPAHVEALDRQRARPEFNASSKHGWARTFVCMYTKRLKNHGVSERIKQPLRGRILRNSR